MFPVSTQNAYEQFTSLMGKHYRSYCAQGFADHKILEKGSEGQTFRARCDDRINYAVQLDFDESHKLRTIFIRIVETTIKSSDSSGESLLTSFFSWLLGFRSHLFYLQPEHCSIGMIKITEDEKVAYGTGSIPHGTRDDYNWHNDYLCDLPVYAMNGSNQKGVAQEEADENGFGDLVKLPKQPAYHTAIRVMLLAGLLYGLGKSLSWGFHKMKTI